MARIGKKDGDGMQYKFSLDLTNENKHAMDEMSGRFGLKYGPFLNLLIHHIFFISDEMKQAFVSFCLAKVNEINDDLSSSDGYMKKQLESDKKSYLDLARIFNGGTPVNYNDEDPTKAKYRMKDGFLVVPKDWIILNPDLEGECRYAGVVECMNHAKYGVPHFVFFTDVQYGCDYDEALTKNIYKWCCEKWPSFNEIIELEKKGKLIPDPEKPGQYLNWDEHRALPVIGLFHILRNDDVYYDDDPPYGAVIVSTTSEKTQKK